jgi:hypothetical protein
MLGLLALGSVPIIIHLLNLRRYQVVRWPAMAFLLKAQVKTRQRLRMENLLLLVARTLAVLLFAIATCRPFLPSAEALAGLGPEHRHLYILIDNSASMGYQEGISTLLSRAAREAESAVDNAVRADDPVTVVVGCDEQRRRNGRPLALLRGTRDHAKVKETLARIAAGPSDARMDPAAALAEVASVVEPGDARRTLLVLSDFPQSDWGNSGDEGGKSAEAIRTQLDRLETLRFDLHGAFRFLGDPDPEDVAVLSVGPADGRAPAEGYPASFEVAVGNNGPAPVQVEVRFLVDRNEIGAQRVSLRGRPARAPSPETARVSFHWSGAAGSHYAEAQVSSPGNRLRANDRRGHAFLVRDRIRARLVDGDPAPADGRRAETWLLEMALSLRRGVAPVDVRVVSTADLDRRIDESEDVVVLANVDRIPDAAWDRLEAFVRRGGGLLVFLGDRVDPALWNAAARRPSTEDLLPARLGPAPRLKPDEPVSLDLEASRHPALKDLTDPRAGTSFDPPLVSGWWPVLVPPEPGAEVLLRLRDLDRSPYLIERHHGRGRVLLCTSTADLDWCGPSLLFAPFVQELVSYLASAGDERRDLVVHEPVVAEVPDAARSITVSFSEKPGSEQVVGRDVEAVRRGEGAGGAEGPRSVSFPDTGAAGMYVLRWKAPRGGGALTTDLETTERHYSVDMDVREADTARMRPETLEERLQKTGLGSRGGEEAAARRRQEEAMRGDLTSTALGLGLLLLLVEMFLAALFGRRRR